jgi:hypothetical protein
MRKITMGEKYLLKIPLELHKLGIKRIFKYYGGYTFFSRATVLKLIKVWNDAQKSSKLRRKTVSGIDDSNRKTKYTFLFYPSGGIKVGCQYWTKDKVENLVELWGKV